MTPQDVTLIYKGDKNNDGVYKYDEYAALIQVEADSVELSACTLVGNDLSGILCRNAEGAVISRCVVRDSNTGILLCSGASTFEYCDIYENQHIGVNIDENGVGTFTNCIIHKTCNRNDNCLAGIWMSGNGTITDCRVYKNESHGIWIDGVGTVKKCNIYENQEDGIAISGGMENITDCEIYENGGSGTAVLCRHNGTESKISFTNCKIHDNRGYGISIIDEYEHYHTGRFKRCVVYGNSDEDVSINDGCLVEFIHCTDDNGNPAVPCP